MNLLFCLKQPTLGIIDIVTENIPMSSKIETFRSKIGPFPFYISNFPQKPLIL